MPNDLVGIDHNHEQAIFFTPEARSRKLFDENGLRENDAWEEFPAIGDIDMKIVEFYQVSFADWTQGDGRAFEQISTFGALKFSQDNKNSVQIARIHIDEN
jgi:hypothetical protein